MTSGKDHPWPREFPGAITVCDMDCKIVYMNARSIETFARYGGTELIGKDLRDCHPPASRKKIDDMLESGETNTYTIEKGGVRKLIYQAPWYAEGERAGLVELSLEIPADMKHFKRD